MDRSKRMLFFPKEHGSWALTFEPLLLALAVSPSRNGLILFLGSALAFFAHPSAKVMLTTRFKNKNAIGIFLAFGVPAAILLILFITTTPYPLYLPLILALILMVVYLLLEAINFDRVLSTELMASLAMGLIALSMVLSGGFGWYRGLGFLAVLYSRTLMSTIYIHYRLLKLKKRSDAVWLNHFLHGLDLVGIFILWSQRMVPLLALIAVLILTFRAIWGVTVSGVKRTTVRKLGFQEVYFGVLFLLLVILGYRLGL